MKTRNARAKAFHTGSRQKGTATAQPVAFHTHATGIPVSQVAGSVGANTVFNKGNVTGGIFGWGPIGVAGPSGKKFRATVKKRGY